MLAGGKRSTRVLSDLRRLPMLAIAATALLCVPASAAPTHPLDPLDAEELLAVREILARSGRFSANAYFAWLQLAEPPKQVVTEFIGGAAFPRKAQADVIDYDKRKTFNVTVDLRAKAIASLTDLGPLQPGLTDRDSTIARDLIDADSNVRDALLKRGFVIPGKISDSVGLRYMSIGVDRSLDHMSNRLMRILFSSDETGKTGTSPSLEGLMAIVDLYARRVVRLSDKPGATPAPVPHDPFDAKLRQQTPLEPAPDRTGTRKIAIDGQLVSWGNWRLRYGFNPREGLVLYQIGFSDNGRVRSILHRASVSEILTAYADPGEFWSWMQIFDEASFGLGYLSAPARPGREVPADALTLSPLLPDDSEPRFSSRQLDRIYVYERDAGNLMLHRDGDRTIHLRATELVIGSFVSLGSYTYGLNWVFRPDGSFAFETELLGVIVTKFVDDGGCATCKAVAKGPEPDGRSRTVESAGDERYGGGVHSRLVGIGHQHWFNLRLDFDIDGSANSATESNVRRSAKPGEDVNGAPFTVRHTIFGTAAEARRDINHETSRTWTVFNPSVATRTGRRNGYTLVPMGGTTSAFPRTRRQEPVGFTLHHLWVTPYRDGEHYAAGRYPGQAKPGYADTLHFYADASPISDRDIVLWYSMGDTHIPRPEDFPLMSGKKMSVVFQPDGFFERNPALNAATVNGGSPATKQP
jgi:primary-amine oxidase